MITRQQMLETAEDPLIRSLNITAFSAEDVVNLILQRSEIIYDQKYPGKVVEAWMNNDIAPAMALVDKMGDELIQRAAAIILLEYREIKPSIDVIAPRRMADIGCGYALFDLFLWQDHKPDLLLVDLEQSSERHFGFRETGSAYSSLRVARQILWDNGVIPDSITCINPAEDDVSSQPPVDLAVSFISCGFHYPVETYLPFFTRGVVAGGNVILDLRARKARDGIEKLSALGRVSILTESANGNGRRVRLEKE